MIKLAEKPSPGCTGSEVVGCRAAEHREKANGVDEACQENRPFGNTHGVAHQHDRRRAVRIARSRPVYAKRRSVVSVAVPEPLLFGTIVKRRWVTWRRLMRCA